MKTLQDELFPEGRVYDEHDDYDRYEQILRMQCLMASDDITDAEITAYMNAMKAKHKKDAEEKRSDR